MVILNGHHKKPWKITIITLQKAMGKSTFGQRDDAKVGPERWSVIGETMDFPIFGTFRCEFSLEPMDWLKKSIEHQIFFHIWIYWRVICTQNRLPRTWHTCSYSKILLGFAPLSCRFSWITIEETPLWFKLFYRSWWIARIIGSTVCQRRCIVLLIVVYVGKLPF